MKIEGEDYTQLKKSIFIIKYLLYWKTLFVGGSAIYIHKKDVMVGDESIIFLIVMTVTITLFIML